jgi:hypothetical protein
MVNNQKAQNPIPTYDSDFNRNLKKAGDKFFACKKNQTIKNNKYLKSVHYHLFYCFFNKIIGQIKYEKHGFTFYKQNI